MYQYKIEKVLKLKGNKLHAVIDLGFGIQVSKTFELGRVEEPELDFTSRTADPEIAMRAFIIQWLKTAPRPLYVYMDKSGDEYVGEVLDRDGRNLADDLVNSYDDEDTQVTSYDYEKHGAVPATTDPAGF